MSRRIGMGFDWQGSMDRETALKRAQIADEVGIDSLWVAEAWGQDAFTTMVQLAERTNNVQVATGIVNIYSRTPAALAQHFATIDELSEGRVIVGLGNSGTAGGSNTSTASPSSRPLSAMRETVEIMKILFSGERLNYERRPLQASARFHASFRHISQTTADLPGHPEPQVGQDDRRDLRRLAADHDPNGPAQGRDRPGQRLGPRSG